MIGILIMTIVSFIISVILVFVYEYTGVLKDKYIKYLPGYNCGACGFVNCEGMSKAMVNNIDNYKKCKLLKNEEINILKQVTKN